MRTSPFEGEYITQRSLYSIETEDKAKEYLDNAIRFVGHSLTFRARIFRGYIPKGSYYLKTDDGCYISDCLVIINKTLDYYPKLSKKFWELNGEKVESYVPENIIPGGGKNNPKTDINCYKVLIHLNGKYLLHLLDMSIKLMRL